MKSTEYVSKSQGFLSKAPPQQNQCGVSTYFRMLRYLENLKKFTGPNKNYYKIRKEVELVEEYLVKISRNIFIEFKVIDYADYRDGAGYLLLFITLFTL